MPSRAALRTHTEWNKAESAPREYYSAASASTYSRRGTPSAVARAREGLHGGSRPVQPSVALKRRPQRTAWLSATALGRNRRCFVATECAVMQQATLRSNRPCNGAVAAARQCVCVRVRAGRRPTLVGSGLTKRECSGVRSAQAGAGAPKWGRASECPCYPAAAMRALLLPSVAQAFE